MLKKKNKVPAMVRRLLLGWLMAVLLEQILLPVQLRDLNTLAGIGKMSLLRLLLVTAAVTILLSILGRNQSVVSWERWGLAGIFFILAVVLLSVTSTWPFLLGWLLVLPILLLYALMGWNG